MVASSEAPRDEQPTAPEPRPPLKPEPPTDQVQLEVAMVPFSPRGCQNDPTAMGCGSFPVPVVRITNKGDPLQLIKIAVNKRYSDPKCVVDVNKTISTGDSWMSEGNPTGDPSAEDYSRWMQGNIVDFRRDCGDQIVFVDVVTNKGSKEYEFGGR